MKDDSDQFRSLSHRTSLEFRAPDLAPLERPARIDELQGLRQGRHVANTELVQDEPFAALGHDEIERLHHSGHKREPHQHELKPILLGFGQKLGDERVPINRLAVLSSAQIDHHGEKANDRNNDGHREPQADARRPLTESGAILKYKLGRYCILHDQYAGAASSAASPYW